MTYHPSWETRPAGIRLAVAAQCNAKPLHSAAIAVLDKLQYLPADVQISAVFITAAVLANAAGLDAHDQLIRARRIVRETEDETLRAIGDYGAGEFR